MEEDIIRQQIEAARPDFDNIPEFLEGDKWFGEDVSCDFLNFADPYTPPRYTLERKGVPFANIGELHVISGKAGHGKTNLMSQLMAAILCGKFGNTVYRLHDSIPEPVVLYIDTEMGKDDTIAIKNRVCSLAGLDYTKPQKQFQVLRLRDTEEAIERWRKILKAVWMVRPTDIFLDGVLDIVEDYNDQKECQPIIRKCMMLATHYDASMWMVLHENPLVDKLVGTLGSITQRKVSEVFTVRKHNQATCPPKELRPDRPQIYFEVQQLKARGRDVDSWDFDVTSESGWGMPREIMDTVPANVYKTTHTPEEVKQWITAGQHQIDWPASKTRFNEYILIPNGITEEWEQEELLTIALYRGFIREQTKKEMKKGQKYPKLIINPEQIKPFEEDDEEMPF